MITFLTKKQKTFFNLKVRLTVFSYFLKLLFKGKVSFGKFIRLLKRLNYFLAAIQQNKFVRIGKMTKFDLYVPAFPSGGFFTAANKFLEFEKTMPCTTVLLSITSSCSYNCPHCYQKFDKGKDIDENILIETIKKLQDMGIAFFNLEGGDPFLRFDRLLKVCRTIDSRSEIFINATGDGLSIEKLNELKQDNIMGIMFPIHSHDKDIFNSFMGKNEAWDNMINGIKACHEAGIAPAFNTCLSREAYYDGSFEKIMEIAKELKISLIQLIKIKPAGGQLSGVEDEISKDDFDHIKKKVHKYNLDKAFTEYPSISAQIIEEDKTLFGCTAGGTDRFYINAKGDLQACEFINISFGNIVTDNFDEIYANMRKHFTGGGDCWVCEKYATKVNEIFSEQKEGSLPLSVEKSKTVYENWDRGEQSDFYRKINNM